jgi:hypothetical protein
MRLTDDEFKRGVVSWDTQGRAVVWVREIAEDGSPGAWSEPLIDPRGSVSPVPLRPKRGACRRAGRPCRA